MNRHFNYPAAYKGDVVETHHGHAIPDPYRWLEAPDAPETRQFIAEQVALTEGFLAEIPAPRPDRAAPGTALGLSQVPGALPSWRALFLLEK